MPSDIKVCVLVRPPSHTEDGSSFEAAAGKLSLAFSTQGFATSALVAQVAQMLGYETVPSLASERLISLIWEDFGHMSTENNCTK